MKQGYTHVSFVLDNSGSMAGLRKDTIGGYNTFLAKQKADPGKMTFSLYQFNKEHRWGGTFRPVVMPSISPDPTMYGPAPSHYPFGGGGHVPMTSPAGPLPLPSVTVGGVGVASPEGGFGIGDLGYDPKQSAVCNASTGMLTFNGIQLSKTIVSTMPGTVSKTYEFIDLQQAPELSMDTYICDCYTPLLDAIGHALVQTGKILEAMPEEERPEKVIFVILTDGEENSSENYNHLQVTNMIKHQQDKYNWDFMFLGANQDAIKAGNSYGITRGRSMSLSATAASMGSSYSAVSDTLTLMKSAVNSKNVNFDDSIRSSVMDGTYNSK